MLRRRARHGDAAAARIAPRSVRRHLQQALGWLAAGVVWLFRQLVRVRIENDPRPALRAAGTPYVYALLHAHQIAALLANDEPRGRMAAMVSRSADGDVIVPSLRACGVRAVRGSSGGRKGGTRALGELRALVQSGVPALLTVDGPRGPRGGVKPGVATLAHGVPDAVVLPCVCVPGWRSIVSGAWDRLQIPWPGTRVTVTFGEPLRPVPGDDHERLRRAIEASLSRLESERDPQEAQAVAVRPPRAERA